jgi:hypothetical protein
MVKGWIKWRTATSTSAFSTLLRGMESIIQAKDVDGFRTLRGPIRPSDLPLLADGTILASFFTASLSPSRVKSEQFCKQAAYLICMTHVPLCDPSCAFNLDDAGIGFPAGARSITGLTIAGQRRKACLTISHHTRNFPKLHPPQ